MPCTSFSLTRLYRVPSGWASVYREQVLHRYLLPGRGKKRVVVRLREESTPPVTGRAQSRSSVDSGSQASPPALAHLPGAL